MHDRTPSIRGFRISGFRTLTNVEVVCDGRLTVITGPNNAGKSSLLTAISAADVIAHGRKQSPLLGSFTGSVAMAADVLGPQWCHFLSDHGFDEEACERLGTRLTELMGTQDVWFGTNFASGEPTADATPLQPLVNALYQIAESDRPVLRNDAQRVLGLGRYQLAARPSVTGQWVHEVREAVIDSPRVRHIVDVRRAAENPLSTDEMATLAVAARHSTKQEKQAEWARTIDRILRDVFGPDVAYEVGPITADSHDLFLSLDGQHDVSVSRVGAGVREVIAIAYRALYDGGAEVLCIEEPENCLHPTAVRRLLTSLLSNINIQLFVSTHSSAVVNAGAHTIVELERAGTTTTSRRIDNAKTRFEAIRALGSSPADLVLTPCAVWVEGPSDRAYLSSWLTKRGLVEGVDYTAAFFGGALGTHLSLASDGDASQTLIELRSISRRCAVVVDSDRSREEAPLKSYVQRWQSDGAGDENLLLAITWGREVENYLPADVVNAVRGKARLKPINARGKTYRFCRILDQAATRRIPKLRFAKLALEELDGEVPDRATVLVDDLAEFIRASAVAPG